MSNIIKSRAVVDQRPDADLRFLVGLLEPEDHAVIKRRLLDGRQIPMRYNAPDRDALLEELNKVRIEIDDAKKEIRAMERQIKDTRREMEKLEEQKAALEKLEGLSIDDQAKAILLDAERQAQQIVELSKKHASEAVDALRTQGYLDGLEQGASEAHEKYSAEHEPDIQRLEALMTELSRLGPGLIQESETDIVQLIITVAEKIIGRSLKDDPKVIVDMLREVLEQNHREEFVKVTVSPDLMPATAKVSESISKMIQQLGNQVNIAVDVTADPGTLLVETAGGYTDLSVQTQLDNIQEMLLEQ